jgi:hypothetical protein
MVEDRHIAQARARALGAARWLRLIGFRAHAEAPVFTPRISTYHDMVDPGSDTAQLAAACRCMLGHVRCQTVVEALEAERLWAGRGREDDPYDLEWRMTERGAILTIVEQRLDDALSSLEAAGAL